MKKQSQNEIYEKIRSILRLLEIRIDFNIEIKQLYNKILNITMLIYLLLFFHLLLCSIYLYGIDFKLFLLFIPFIIYYFYEKYEKTKSNIFLLLVKLLLILVIPVYYVLCYIGTYLFDDLPYHPSRLIYPLAIKDLQKHYKNTDFSYFPQHIPLNAFNYKCTFYRPFDGYNYKYILSFRTTRNYIEKVIERNCKDKYCLKHQHISDIPTDHDVYLLSLRRYCDDCDMGFAINKEINSIYFFWINND